MFPRGDLEMMLAMRADLQIVVQVLVEHHRGALGYFWSKGPRDVVFAALGVSFGFLRKEVSLAGGGDGCSAPSAQRLFVKVVDMVGFACFCRHDVCSRGKP